jgi:tetratricopeptide (TPR) repeat protein
MPRRRVCIVSFLLLALLLPVGTLFAATPPRADQVQVTTPALRSIEPPPQEATAQMLEERADALRAEKLYLDALDYYRAAISKKPHDAPLYNKMGIVELLMQRWPEARKSFENAIHANKAYSDAYNNLGVIFYISKKYGKAIDRYNKAIKLNEDMASYYSNLGAALFSKKEFEKSAAAYAEALSRDPDVFERTSKNGVAAQMARPEDRAHYDYVVAKIYAKMGVADRSLEYLRKALEEGYKGINSVYKDSEFSGVRKDPRFNQLMASRIPAITD